MEASLQHVQDCSQRCLQRVGVARRAVDGAGAMPDPGAMTDHVILQERLVDLGVGNFQRYDVLIREGANVRTRLGAFELLRTGFPAPSISCTTGAASNPSRWVPL